MTPLPAGNDVAEFIRALALAWKNLAAYPPGHPALSASLTAADHAFAKLRGPAGEVTLGIANDGIVFSDSKIDSTQAQKLAQALYSRSVAVVRFAGDTTAEDLEKFLRLLGTAPGETAPALWEALTAAGVMSINLQPVDYSAVRITNDLEAQPPPKRESLWEEILRALVAGRELSPKSQQILTADIRSVDELAALMLRYIETADDESKFDPDATFGVRLSAKHSNTAREISTRVADAIGAHIGSTSGLRRQLAVQQVIQLLRTMPEPLRGAIIKSILRPLATDESAASQLREVAASLHHDEVLEALRVLAAAGTLSTHAMTLLNTLAALDAKHEQLPAAPQGIVTELVQLFAEDDIDRFNPDDHTTLLREVNIRVPRVPPGALSATAPLQELGARVETIASDAVDRQLATTVLDLIAKHHDQRDISGLLSRAESLFASEVRTGHFDDALELANGLSEFAVAAVAESFARMAARQNVETLVDSLANASPDKSAKITRLLDTLGTAAARTLLLALSEEQNRSRRRRLFDLVSSLGARIVPQVIEFLSDERWFVIRNMILLLRSVGDRTSLPEIRLLAQHPDLRVRLEAIKTLLAFDKDVPQPLLADAINARDPKVAETAIALAGNYGIKEAVDPLLRIVERRDLFGTKRQIRILAIKALGELAEPRALPQMEHLFSTSILPWPHRTERQAAFESLAAYPPEERAEYVERGLRSRDPVVRMICRRLGQSS